MTIPHASLVEYEEDMIIYENDSKILEEFYDAAKNIDTNKTKEKVEIVEALPFDSVKKGPIYPREGGRIDEYDTRPWKARELDRKELMLTEINEEIHPYLTRFFDIAVRENMRAREEMLDNFQKSSMSVGFPCGYDGNYEIAQWLDMYAKTASLFEKKGKKIVEPQTFREYPVLKDYVAVQIHLEELKKLLESVRKKNYIASPEEIKKIALFMLEGKKRDAEWKKDGKQYTSLSAYEIEICPSEIAPVSKNMKKLLNRIKKEMKAISAEQKTQGGNDKANSNTKLEKVRERVQKKYLSGTVIADKIAEDMISGKEKRTVTRAVGKELSDKIKKEYALSKKQKE